MSLTFIEAPLPDEVTSLACICTDDVRLQGIEH
jgi:hypothetical protein